MLARLLRLLPEPVSRRLARHAAPFAILAVALVLFAGVAVAALVSPGAVGITAARLSETRDLPDALRATGLTERDSDNDGLSDALENYLYGTDPQNWNSSGLGIPDGWLAQFGHDPLSPLTREARGAAPPPDALPAAYADGYPLDHTPTLDVYYHWGKPASYRPGEDAPWWRSGPHADPSQWDQAGTGVPTGWLLHHGLDPVATDPDRVAPGAKGNLTVREAFTHDTDPLADDSDGDGLGDWLEIHVHRTDPSKFSTGGSGIADGWLLRHGLNPFDRVVGTQDPDLDGLTNLEEFVVSHETFRDDVARDGLAVLFARGLDPLDWETAKTGIPDGWYVKYGLSPFGADVARVLGRASDWPEARNLDSAPEGFEPLPDLVMTVRDAYAYGRPSDWNETVHGVWWGGTDPVSLDTDADGMPDPVEIRGWYANVTTDAGPEAKPRVYLTTSNPLEADSDADGLGDLEEHRGRAACDGDENPRAFPPTDPRNRDTAFSGLTDYEKVCGVVRGGQRYDLHASQPGVPFLDPTRADSAGDHMTDGARVAYWHERFADLRANPRYPYEGSAYKTVFEWTETYARFASLGREDTLAQFRPDGDVDGDGVPNALDADPSGGLFLEKNPDPGAPATKVFFLGGPQMDPRLYRFTEFSSSIPRTATDPANPDTDGDGLPDFWETRYGVFDARVGGWNLDPAKRDSDGDGVTDDQANNDRDAVTWYAYDRRGGGIERAAHEFVFHNLLEYLAGTNPNEASTMGDGVPDGWKAFWGSRASDETYPNLVAARDERIGGVALAKADEIEASILEGRIQPLADLRDAGAKATGYVRFANVTECVPGSAALDALLRRGETLAAEPCYVGQNLEGDDVRIAIVEGVATLSYAREAELRTNPYLDDTDGDGAPDAYEAHVMVRTPGASAYPDPAAPDADKDPDGDGVGVADECGSRDDGRSCGLGEVFRDGVAHGAGLDPHAADTDGDGIQDGIELNAALDPLDPSDVEGFRDPSRDSDGDGVPDYLELTGWGKAEFGVSVRTDPQDFDTDGDGLLDGPTTNVDPRMTAGAARAAAFDARGIAHRARADGTIDYLGERTYGAAFGFRPDKAKGSDAQPAPDGWLAYHDKPATPDDALAEAYAAFRPDWWVEARHGVWWWGLPPGQAEDADPDLDGDGLRDSGLEDPFPGMSRLNRVVSGDRVMTDPDEVRAWVAAAATTAEARERAQRLGEGAGDPVAARAAAKLATDANGVPTRLDRARVAIVDVAVPNGATVTKGATFAVEGRVVLDERQGGLSGGALLEGAENARVGLANRTVLLSFFRPSGATLVGAALTDADGRFRVEGNTSGLVEVPLPGGALLGLPESARTATGARLPVDPAVVATGDATAGQRNRLVVWVLNTSATVAPGAPTHAEHLAWLPDAEGAHAARTTVASRFAVSAPVDVTVRSGTRLSTTLPSVVENGDPLVGDLRLTDTSGAPVADKPVLVRWDGGGAPVEFRNLSTDRNGRVNVTNLGLFARVPQPEQRALTATFASTDPNLDGTSAAFPVAIRQPTELRVTLGRAAATVGDALDVQGVLLARSVVMEGGAETGRRPVPSAPVRITLGGAEETATTDDLGEFRVRLTVPGTLAAGPNALTATFAGTERESPSEARETLSVKRTSALVGLNRLEGPRGIDVTLRGRLVDNEGKGFAGPVTVDAAGFRVAEGRANDEGAFSLVVPLERLPLGAQQLRVAFPGDGARAAAENLTQARVTSTTTLRVDEAPPAVVRGDPFETAATLLDDRGAPVASQPVEVRWRGERVGVLVTDAQGRVRATIATNATERPAASALGFEYLPSATSVYQPASAAATVAVLQGTLLEVDPKSVHRGPVAVTGRLLDDEGRPLAAAAVSVTLGDQPLGEARTARNGSFELVRALADDAPLGPVGVTVRYAGTPTLAGAEMTQEWRVRSPLLPQWTALGPFVRGEPATFDGRVVDDQGKGVDATLRVALEGRDLGTLVVRGGVVRTALPVPADAPRGPATLVLAADETPTHDAFRREVPVVVKVRPQVEVQLPALAVRGFAFAGDLTLRDDEGQPLRNTSFVYVVGPGGGPVLGETDADGRARLASVAPISGDAFLALTVRGGGDVVAAEYRTPDLRVVGPATPVGYAGLVLAVVAALAVVGLVVAAALLRRRQLEEVRDILDEAIRDLLAGNEYAGTVFLAYRRLSTHLARHGFAEKAHETPREFALGVRKALPVGAVPLRELIRLFEEARYSDHAIGSVERDRAVESLGLVRAELDRLLGKTPAAPEGGAPA